MKIRLKSVVACTMALTLALVIAQKSTSADEVVPESPITTLTRNLNPANWKMPDFSGLLPAQDEKARIKKKKDGLMGEVTTTASNSWSKTKEMFNPQKLNPAKMFPASARTPSKTSEPKKPGFFQSLFAPPEPEEASTVNEFLSQSRPSP